MSDLPNYTGNSHKSKRTVEGRERRAPVVATPPTRVKPSFMSSFRELFGGGDARSVAMVVVEDVIFPAIRDLIFNVATEGVRGMLWGDLGRGPSHRFGRDSRYTPYNRPSERREREPRQLDRRERATHDFSSLVFRNRGDAELILDRLFELNEEYGTATVADFYDAAGITNDFPDSDFGWSGPGALRGAGVRTVQGGYILELPRPRPID